MRRYQWLLLAGLGLANLAVLSFIAFTVLPNLTSAPLPPTLARPTIVAPTTVAQTTARLTTPFPTALLTSAETATAAPTATPVLPTATSPQDFIPTETPTALDTPTPLPTPIPTLAPGSARIATDGEGLRLRQSPGTAGVVLNLLDALTPLQLIGRTGDNVWAEVSTPLGNGWVMAQWIETDLTLAAFPVTGVAMDSTATLPPPTRTPRPAGPTATRVATQPPQPGIPMATPLPTVIPAPAQTQAPIPPSPTAPAQPNPTYPPPPAYPYISGLNSQLRSIYLAGRALGNRSNVFAKIGDSITVEPYFLTPIGQGQIVLHDYTYLQPVIDYFSTERAYDANSFASRSLAADYGWSAWTALDINWADHSLCLAGEAPLRCEYRLVKPAIALIMFGTNDAVNSTPEVFRANLSTLVNVSIQMGVIPVLSTIPDRYLGDIPPERVFDYNAVIVDVAQTYNIPLWDYWSSLQGLPNHGIGDSVHPSYPPNASTADFSAENLQYGYTVRNLGALFILDALWRQIITQG